MGERGGERVRENEREHWSSVHSGRGATKITGDRSRLLLNSARGEVRTPLGFHHSKTTGALVTVHPSGTMPTRNLRRATWFLVSILRILLFRKRLSRPGSVRLPASACPPAAAPRRASPPLSSALSPSRRVSFVSSLFPPPLSQPCI